MSVRMAMVGAAGLLVGLSGGEAAGGVVAQFGFEGLHAQALDTPIVLMDAGVTVEISAVGGSIVDGPTLPGVWGQRSLSLDAGSMVISFVGGASGFSIELGDFGDDEDFISFAMFTGSGGTGAQIDTGSYYWNADLATTPPQAFAWAYAGGGRMIGSVVLTTGADDGGLSLLYDNLTVTVPGPGGVGLFVGLGLLARRSRRF